MRRYLTARQKVAMLARQGYKCALCDTAIDGTGKTCIGEHWTPVALGNDNKPDCLLCIPCADRKTNGTKATTYGSDKHAIAKVRRLRGETKTGPKKKIPSRGFDKTLRKKFDGTVERRT